MNGLSPREQVFGVGARVIALLDTTRDGLSWKDLRLKLIDVPVQEIEGTLNRLKHAGRITPLNGTWRAIAHPVTPVTTPHHTPIPADSAIAHLPPSDMAAITLPPRIQETDMPKHRCNTCERHKEAAEMRQFGGKPTGICKACFSAKRAATMAKGGPGVVRAEKEAKAAKPERTIREVVERHVGKSSSILEQLRHELAALEHRGVALKTAIAALEGVYP